MSKRLTEAQKRRRHYARTDGKASATSIDRAIRYQRDATWFAARPQYADLAETWQRLSNQCLDSAVANARYAAHWARLSQETV